MLQQTKATNALKWEFLNDFVTDDFTWWRLLIKTYDVALLISSNLAGKNMYELCLLWTDIKDKASEFEME